MATEDSHCTTCRRKTTWEIHKKYQQCQGCRGRFPCARGCLHLDCREERGEVDVCLICRVYKDKGSTCETRGCLPKRPTEGV